MRLAWVSPLPPTRSGIADYSAELLPALAREVDLTLFAPAVDRPTRFQGRPVHPLPDLAPMSQDVDLIVYHMGNNPYHVEIYDLARNLPGVVVLHDYILHHLVARCTAQAGDLPGYIWHMAYEGGGVGARAAVRRALRLFSEREQFLYPLNRALLDRSLGVVVHNLWAAGRIAQNHPGLKVRRIPHHLAPIPPASREDARRRLGIAKDEVLVATFGFLSRTKRVGSLLRAHAVLQREYPQARCFLVGEPEAGLGLPVLLDRLGLQDRVTVTGYVDLEQFYGYIAACDVAVNLRYPSAGETSGALVRLLGGGKAVIVSNLYQFAEWPDDICLKVDLGPAEEAMLLYYLRRLVEDAGLRRQLGENAREYVGTQHALAYSARCYVGFFEELLSSGDVL